MIYIIPRRLIIELLPLAVLMCVMFVAGAILYHTAHLLFTAPKSLTVIDWALAIPAALVAGWLLLRFANQMFKSSLDQSGSGLLSAVGVKAGFALLMALVAFAAPLCMAAMGALDRAYPQFYSHTTTQFTPWQPAIRRTTPPASHGTIYIAPPVSPAPTAQPTTPSNQ